MCGAKSDVRFTPNSDRESGFSQKVMSALPPKADMCGAHAHVCFGPKADIASPLPRDKLLPIVVRNFDDAFRFVCNSREIIFYRMVFQVSERNRAPELAHRKAVCIVDR